MSARDHELGAGRYTRPKLQARPLAQILEDARLLDMRRQEQIRRQSQAIERLLANPDGAAEIARMVHELAEITVERDELLRLERDRLARGAGL